MKVKLMGMAMGGWGKWLGTSGMCSPCQGGSPTAATCAGIAWGSRSTLGLLHGLSLKKLKLGVASLISGEVDGVGKQQLTVDDITQLVGAILPFLSFFFLFFLSSSPFPFSGACA